MDQDRLERVRLLSRRFRELHGLYVVLVGASLAVVMGGYLVATPTPTNDGALIALGVSVMPMIPGVWWLKRYYTSTFGRQVSKPPDARPFLFLIVYVLISFSLNAVIPEIPAGAPTAAIVVLVSALVAIRDWPWRAYYLAAPAAVVIAFAATASGGGFLEPNLTLVTIFLALGAALIPIGLLDHWLLVRLVREARGAGFAAPEET
jgi:hypothetical protein